MCRLNIAVYHELDFSMQYCDSFAWMIKLYQRVFNPDEIIFYILFYFIFSICNIEMYWMVVKYIFTDYSKDFKEKRSSKKKIAYIRPQTILFNY